MGRKDRAKVKIESNKDEKDRPEAEQRKKMKANSLKTEKNRSSRRKNRGPFISEK